ncbi:PLP-dependent aminotransferase family protein, partial [Pseudomonas sp. MWU13-2860]
GRDAMQASLQRHFSDLADWQLPQGGLFFWLKLKQPRDTRQLLPLALQQNIAFMPGEAFFPDPERNLGYLRLNFSHASPERIETGIARLAALLREQAAIV